MNTNHTFESSAAERPNDANLAYYEAGHCFGFWLTRTRFRASTIRPRTPGFNALTSAYRDFAFDQWQAATIVAICGPFADMWHRQFESEPGDDIDDIERAVADGSAHGLERCAWVLSDAAQIDHLHEELATYWEGVSLVASELLEHHTITGARAFELFDSVSTEGPPRSPFHFSQRPPWLRSNKP